MRSRKYLFVIIFLIFLLSTILVFKNPYAGDDIKQSSDQIGAGDIDIDELINRTVRQVKSIGRYYQDTEIIYRCSEIKNGESENKSLDMVMTSRVDNLKRIHWSSINSTFDEGEYLMNVELEMFSTADVLYIDIRTDGESPGWVRTKQVTTSWNKLVSFDDIIAVLEKEVVRDSRDDFEGDTPCYVLVVPVKDVNIIYRTIKNLYGLENQFRYSYELVQAFADDFIYEIWIDKESLFVVKNVVRMQIEVYPEQVTGMVADYTMYSLLVTSDNYKINQPFSIEIPEELDDAPMIYTINE